MASSGPGMAAYRAPSLFQPHRARQALRDAHDGKIAPLVGMYLGLSSIPTARFIAPLGFDAVWIDWEHTSCNTETMTTIVHEIMFMSEGKTIPFVRIPGHDHAAIAFAMDAGASVVVPRVDTVEQAKHVLAATKYGKRAGGFRSAPPFRMIPGVSDQKIDPSKTHHENMNEQAALMIQIESAEGINNLDAILTECPEIDAVWLGSLDARVSEDLAAGFGIPQMEPEWRQLVGKYEMTVRKHNKPRSSFAMGPPEQMKMMGNNNCMNYVSFDVLALMGMMREIGTAKAMFPPKKAYTEDPAALEAMKQKMMAAMNGGGAGQGATNGEAKDPAAIEAMKQKMMAMNGGSTAQAAANGELTNGAATNGVH